MFQPIKTIFHASFTCVTENGRHDKKSRIEYYTYKMNKRDFWEWINMHLDEFKEYKSVTIDSINMI